MSTVKTAAEAAISAGIPVLLNGSPGTGKTAWVTELAQQKEWYLETVIASIHEPADFGGWPTPTQGGLVFSPPPWARKLAEAAHKGRALLFLDEISTAPPAVQAALLRVVLELCVGDLKLPSNVSVVAACNPMDQAAGGWNLSAPLANRFLHFKWDVNPVEVADGFASFWGKKVDERVGQFMSEMAGFFRARPELILKVPENETERGGAWPSPRSWENGAKMLASVEGDTEASIKGLAAAVGPSASEFMVWKKQADLPDPKDVLEGKVPIPDRDDRAFATLSAVAGYVTARVGEVSEKELERLWYRALDVAGRAASEGKPDLVVPAARKLVGMRQAKWKLPTTLAPLSAVLSAAGM